MTLETSKVIFFRPIKMEGFKRHPVYTDYAANKDGEIYSFKSDKLMSPCRRPNGYYKIDVFVDGRHQPISVHKFVYECFHGLIQQRMQIDHINHIRDDNRVENLRVVSASQNCMNRISAKGRQFDFINELPEDAKEVFGIYYSESNDQFYGLMFDGSYRTLHISDNRIQFNKNRVNVNKAKKALGIQ